MKSGRLVVKHREPWQSKLFLAIFVILVISGGVGLYFLGQYNAGFSHFEARDAQTELEATIDKLQSEKAALRDRIALIEQTTEVDRQASVQLKEDLRALQQENLELREEVSFYRGIVAPRESSAGIRVDRFKIEPVNDKGLFHYNFVLTQVLKNDRSIRGSVKISIDGIEKGRPKVLSFASVSTDNSKQLDFKFRYFQKFEGDLVMPDGFAPRQIMLEINPFKRKTVNTNIQWPDATSADDGIEATATE